MQITKDLAHKYMQALRSADGDVLFKAAKLKNQKLKKKLKKNIEQNKIKRREMKAWAIWES